MDLQTEAVAGAMEKTLHAAVAPARPITFAHEEVLNGAMHVRGWHPGAHLLERQALALKHRVVQLPHRLTRPATDHGAGDIAEIAGLLGAGKDVQDNGLIGAQRAMAALVRVAALSAAGDDCVAGKSAGLEDGGVDDGPQLLRRHQHIMVEQPAARGDLRPLQHLDTLSHADLRHK